jgi:primosomal replication protein N
VDVNRVALRGELKAIEPLRHSPAGIPLLNFKLAHRSQQVEAGYKRQVECELNGIAAGEVALAIARLRPGSEVSLEGFLNRKNRMSVQLMLHVTKVETLEDTDHAKNGTEQSQG